MQQLLLAGAAVAALLAGPAMAADLPVRAPIYKAPVATYYNWSGCYVGGNVGGLWVHKDWTAAPNDFFPLDSAFGSHDANGWLGGIQGGCNYQVGGWVFGIQGDYDWANAEGNSPDALNSAFFGVGYTDASKVKSLSSVTGRVGYAWDRFLGYVKGGGAWERDNYTMYPAAGGFPWAWGSETRSGWTVGVGGEYAFINNLTAFIEYDYYSFGTQSVTFLTPGGFAFDYVNIKETKSVVKVGVNWKFGPVPLFARY
jgi:outer membrane immunogenic protein